MSPGAAAAEARRRFGNIAEIEAECVDVDRHGWRADSVRMLIDHLRGDVRFALRSLRRSPLFSVVVVATLAIGIASMTAIFSYVYAFYWRPLPFTGVERMIAIAERRASGHCCYSDVTAPVARIIATSSRSFARTTLYESRNADVFIGDTPRQLHTLLIDTSFAPTFSIHPQLGRLFAESDAEANASVAIISARLWRVAFGGDSTIVGRRLDLDKRQVTIVGVMQNGFGFPWATDVWLPRPARGGKEGEGQSVGVIGTLRPGVSRASAESELHVVAVRISRDATLGVGRTTLRVKPEVLDRRASQGAPLPTVFIGAGLVLLLIASANVMNLFLARTAERSREIAIRSSIGATRARLVVQLLTETLLLACFAGALGTVGAVGLLRAARGFYPSEALPAWLTFDLDGRVLLFVLVIIVLVTIAIGLTPALEGSRRDVMRTLKIGGDGGASRRGPVATARRGLTVQLALSIALFIAAGIFVRSYEKLKTIDYGYPAEQAIDVTYYYGSGDSDDRAHLALATEVAERLANMPGNVRSAVRSETSGQVRGSAPDTISSKRVSLSDYRLFADRDTSRSVGWPKSAPEIFAVSDNYFSTLGLRLSRGRTFSADDAANGMPVAVVGERLAAELWPHGNAIGGIIQRGLDGTRFTVVGIVQDAHDVTTGSRGTTLSTPLTAYLSVRQVEGFSPSTIARWSGPITTLESTARGVVRELNPRVVTRADPFAHGTQLQSTTKIFGGVIATFAISGVLLAVIGLYGLVSYGVAQRRREIGVRIAFGATQAQVIFLIVTDGLRFTIVGVIAGLILSLGAGRLVRVLVFDVPAVDPIVYAIACAAFGTIALLASLIPALRAARINPMTALKSD
jgi:putative ABC transport system permease protein